MNDNIKIVKYFMSSKIKTKTLLIKTIHIFRQYDIFTIHKKNIVYNLQIIPNK